MHTQITWLQRYSCAVLIAISAIVLLAGIDGYSLQGSTEPREAGIAAEMLQSSDYIVPRLNGRIFLEKPPLSYWLQMGALKVFGYQPAAARLPSILAGVVCVCLVFFGVRKIGDDAAPAWLAALLLLTMASFWMNARTAGQDALLACGVALALFSFNAARDNSTATRAWLFYSAGIAVATFSKGVVGLAVPGAVILCYLLVETFALERRFVPGNWLRPAVYAAVGLIPLALWLYLLARRAGADAVGQILWANSVERFAGDYRFDAHAEPFYYYLQKLPETFAPWNLLVFFSLWRLRRDWHDRNVLFFCCWLLAPYVLLSLSAGKRPPYLLMLYPAAAVLPALLFERLRRMSGIDRSALRVAQVQAVLLSGAAIFLVWHAWRLHVHAAAIVMGVLLAIAGAAMWRALAAHAWRRMAIGALSVALMFYLGYGGALWRHEHRRDSPEAIFAKMQSLERSGHRLILFRPLERIAGASSFYLEHKLPSCSDAQQLQKLLDGDARAVALVEMDDSQRLRNYRVVADFTRRKRGYMLIAREAAD